MTTTGVRGQGSSLACFSFSSLLFVSRSGDSWSQERAREREKFRERREEEELSILLPAA